MIWPNGFLQSGKTCFDSQNPWIYLIIYFLLLFFFIVVFSQLHPWIYIIIMQQGYDVNTLQNTLEMKIT